MTHSTSLVLTNRTGRDSEVWIEPWGDCVLVPPDQALTVVAEATEAGTFELEYRDGGDVTVWAWPTASVRCYVAGVEVKAGAFAQPTPPVPPGMTTSGFLRLAMGPAPERGR